MSKKIDEAINVENNSLKSYEEFLNVMYESKVFQNISLK